MENKNKKKNPYVIAKVKKPTLLPRSYSHFNNYIEIAVRFV